MTTASLSPARSLWREGLILGALVVPGPFAVDMFLPAMPDIAGDLGASVAATQLTLTAYFIAFGLAQMLYGPWSDAAGASRRSMPGSGSSCWAPWAAPWRPRSAC